MNKMGRKTTAEPDRNDHREALAWRLQHAPDDGSLIGDEGLLPKPEGMTWKAFADHLVERHRRLVGPRRIKLFEAAKKQLPAFMADSDEQAGPGRPSWQAVCRALRRPDHGPGIAPVEKQIIDADGLRSLPIGRAVDSIAVLAERGTIDAQQLKAAERFRDDFDAAFVSGSSGGLGATGKASGPSDPIIRSLGAYSRVSAALSHLGGHATLGASAVWHVVGEGMSIRETSARLQTGGRVSTNALTISGALQAALSSLAGHYGLVDRRALPINHHAAQLETLGGGK